MNNNEKEWMLIQKKFNRIRDNRSRAAGKLNDLANILFSAYKIDSGEADKMWQYIIDLNIADNINFSKFYIAQVFNKLTQRMSPADVTAFLILNPKRERLMILYGYDAGPTLWHCLEVLIRGHLILRNVDKAVTCIGYFYEKFDVDNLNNTEIKIILSIVGQVCADLNLLSEYKRIIINFLDIIGDSEYEEINTFVRVIKVLNGIEKPSNCNKLWDILICKGFKLEFFSFMVFMKNDCSSNYLKFRWIEYVQQNKMDKCLPDEYFRHDNELYGISKLKFYVDLEKKEDQLLELYFQDHKLSTVQNNIIWSWIEENDWDRFTKYLALTLMNTSSDSFISSDIYYTIRKYMHACFQTETSYSVDMYNRDYKELMLDKQIAFSKALVQILLKLNGYEIQKVFFLFVKEFIQKTQ